MSKRLLALLVALFATILFASGAVAQHEDAEAEGTEETAVEHEEGGLTQWEAERGKFVAIAMGLGLGLSVLGGTLGQSRATKAALDGLARNPGAYDKVFTPFILGMVLIESLVIYSLVVSLILLGALGG